MKPLIQSFKNAFRGIFFVFRSERNMMIHLIIATLVVIFGWIFHINPAEWILCLICFALVITAEMINTALENIVDLISPERNHLAGKAKDIAAGAVLITAIIAAIIGLIIFIPKIWNIVSQFLA